MLARDATVKKFNSSVIFTLMFRFNKAILGSLYFMIHFMVHYILRLLHYVILNITTLIIKLISFRIK